nr:uncharacterized protein LOC115269869 [Aedes albopictus]
MPEAIITSEPLQGYSGGSQEAPIIVQQQPVPERSAARENNVVDTQGIRYVVVDEMAVMEKTAKVGQAGSLEELLQSAGLEEYTHTLQNDHGITSVQMFAEMEKEDVNLFCQVISHRIQFRKLLVELKDKSEFDFSAVSDGGHQKFSNLRDFLQNRPEGRSILAYHEAHKDLSNAMRNELVRIILLEGLNLKLTLDSKFHSLMTGKIIQLFPGEKQV